MNILVVGSGAREHAIAWKLAQNPEVKNIYAAPGNPGLEEVAELVSIQADEIDKLVQFALNKEIYLVVVGPEVPLVMGLADELEKHNIFCFGPKKQGALLEGSKKFAKNFMKKFNIPTARYEVFDSAFKAREYLESLPEGPIVVKADGLAQGKGVVVASNRQEAIQAIQEMIDDKCFGDAGAQVVIEEFLTGEEASLLTFVDGKNVIPMLPVQDHKRIGEGDTGLNTGGMGTYAPTSVYTAEIDQQVKEQIITPIKKALAEELNYCGCLYIGLMLTPEGPKVIEFNARFGDPETEVLMPLLKSDLLEIMLNCVRGTLKESDVVWKKESAVCVILASAGYPEEYQKGFEIKGLKDTHTQISEENWIFQAGTKKNSEGNLVTSGGRVLAAVATANSFSDARKKVYENIQKVSFDGMYFRKDIGHREESRILE